MGVLLIFFSTQKRFQFFNTSIPLRGLTYATLKSMRSTCGKSTFSPVLCFRLNTLIFHIPVLRAIKAWQPRLEVYIREIVTFDEDFRLSQRASGNEGNIFAISADDLGQGNLSDLSQLASGECRSIGVQGWVWCVLVPKTISTSEASELLSYNTAKGITHKTSKSRWRFR